MTDDREIGNALSYQEAAARCLPILRNTSWQPYLVWPIAGGVILTVVVLVIALFSFSSGWQWLTPHVADALGWSYAATVYEILGIILGCAMSERLAAKLPAIVQFTSDEAERWREGISALPGGIVAY